MAADGATVVGWRVLLDANVPPAVSEALARYGHDVTVASGDPALEALNDADLLREATRQDRVLVTFNIADFVELARECAHRNEDHKGIIVIDARTYPRKEVGPIARALDKREVDVPRIAVVVVRI